MVRIGHVIGLVVMVSGCASSANFEKKLDELIGMSREDLVDAWGYPHATSESGNVTLLAYEELPPGYITGTFAIPSNFSTMTEEERHDFFNPCHVTFAIDDGSVAGYTYEGTYCKRR